MTDEALSAILTRMAELETRLKGHADVIASMSDLAVQVHQMSELVADLTLKIGPADDDKPGRMPGPTPQWHKLTDEEFRAECLKLRGYQKTILPLYGHMVKIGKCVEDHPLAVMALEVLGEYHQTLFMGDRRPPSILAGQADALIRVMPGLLAIIATETVGCSKHDDVLNPTRNPGGAR